MPRPSQCSACYCYEGCLYPGDAKCAEKLERESIAKKKLQKPDTFVLTASIECQDQRWLETLKSEIVSWCTRHHMDSIEVHVLKQTK
jgi:hypothetical protein